MNRGRRQTRAWLARSLVIASLLLLLLIASSIAAQQQRPQPAQVNFADPNSQAPNYPFYLQSPIQPPPPTLQNVAQNSDHTNQVTTLDNNNNNNNQRRDAINEQSPIVLSRRTNIPLSPQPVAISPPINQLSSEQQQQQQQVMKQQQQTKPTNLPTSGEYISSPTTSACLYDKSYFAKFDECLARRPYPIIGLPAFKNEDLLIKRGLSDKHGCAFILSNGLFKNHQLSKYSIDSDSRCLDQGAVQLSLQFSNVTLAYLWTLRCLNQADQLFDDATFNGKTTINKQQQQQQQKQHEQGICVGSSQSFGFTSVQLTNIEAQVELATDIYKNWRLTNVSVALLNHQPPAAMSTMRSYATGGGGGGASAASAASALGQPKSSSTTGDQAPHQHNSNKQQQAHHHHSNTIDTSESSPVSSALRDFVFESLDGDELNWRYLHLYRNWSRNQIHTNFMEQFRRFLWISLQRCLSESSDKLPVKLVDLFGQQKYN